MFRKIDDILVGVAHRLSEIDNPLQSACGPSGLVMVAHCFDHICGKEPLCKQIRANFKEKPLNARTTGLEGRVDFSWARNSTYAEINSGASGTSYVVIASLNTPAVGLA